MPGTIAVHKEQRRTAGAEDVAPSALYQEMVCVPSPVKPTAQSILTQLSKKRPSRSDDERAVRRGEIGGCGTKYQGFGGDVEGFQKICESYANKEVTNKELVELYERGKITFAPSTIRRYVKRGWWRCPMASPGRMPLRNTLERRTLASLSLSTPRELSCCYACATLGEGRSLSRPAWFECTHRGGEN